MNAVLPTSGSYYPEDARVQVKALTEQAFDRWDEFVLGCAEASFFHRAGWKTVMEKAFGHSTHFLFAEQQETIVGVLPLVHVKSLLFGNMLSSAPFCVYGGVAAKNDNVRKQLEHAACELAQQLGVDSLEMRNTQPQRPDWASKDLYVTFRKEIDADPEVNLKAIPRKQRAMVRKGIKAGLEGDMDDGVDRLYSVYSESVRNLGTPVFARKYLRILREVFADDCGVLMITHRGQDVAGVMSFYFKDQVLPYYGGSLPAARSIKGNDYMYWDLMCRAAEKGVRIFDYGRSKKGTGSYSFKKNWGFVAEPLHYEYYLVNAREMPQINPTNPKYRYFIKMWQKLPLPVANFVGPLSAKDLGCPRPRVRR